MANLELHVWGPAFGLPSIDVECLAAIAYFSYVVPAGRWSLIASNDAAAHPSREWHAQPSPCFATSASSSSSSRRETSPDSVPDALPALRDADNAWVTGYTAIVRHLDTRAGFSLDRDLSSLQRADLLAYTTYLRTRGDALLSLSLYVLPGAWSAVTRPAYSSLVPVPLAWTVPPALRRAAISRAATLGLDLDRLSVSADPASSGDTPPPPPTTNTQTGFLRLASGPSSLRSSPEHAEVIRMHGLAADFFAVLDASRADKPFLLAADAPSSLDFLAAAYLALMRVPTPRAFLRRAVDARPGLCRLLDAVHRLAWPLDGTPADLPWSPPPPRGVLATATRFAEDVAEELTGGAWRWWRRRGVGGDDDGDGDDRRRGWASADLLYAVGTLVAGLTAVGSMLVFQALPPFGAPTHYFEGPAKSRGLPDGLGRLGAMLGALPMRGGPSGTRSTPSWAAGYGSLGWARAGAGAGTSEVDAD